MPSQLEIQREIAAADVNIALAELEEARAAVRTKELSYTKQKLVLDVMVTMCKAESETQKTELSIVQGDKK